MSAFLKTSLDQSATETGIEGLEEPTDWSKDGWIAAGSGKIVVGSAKGGQRVSLTTPPGREYAARFSSDSKWLAYSSDESGRSEIYVRAFSGRPDPSAAKIQVSDSGGEYPMWNETGTELYYMAAGSVVFAVDTSALAAGKVSAPVHLFKACSQSQPGNPDAGRGAGGGALNGAPYFSPLDTRDGKRFLVACLVDPPGQYTVLMNWEGASR